MRRHMGGRQRLARHAVEHPVRVAPRGIGGLLLNRPGIYNNQLVITLDMSRRMGVRARGDCGQKHGICRQQNTRFERFQLESSLRTIAVLMDGLVQESTARLLWRNGHG